MTLYAILGTIVLAILGAFGLSRKSTRAAEDRIGRKQAETALKDERDRNALDAEIQDDTDLVARARRAGVVRDDGPKP